MTAKGRVERSLRATIAYDGSRYFGWQWQPDRPTVQGEVEAALEPIAGKPVRVVASGRTDTGVHAVGQVVGFRMATRLDLTTLRRAWNAHLPDDIAVREVAAAPEGFDPVRHAVSKRYRYTIQDGSVRDVLSRHVVWWIPRRLDVVAMRCAARWLLGKHDFAAFETSGSRRVSTVRRVTDLIVERQATGVWDRVVIEVESNGFLYNMVRNIVGTLMVVGVGKERPEWVADVLASRDRRRAGPTAPPQGLCLLSVRYRT